MREVERKKDKKRRGTREIEGEKRKIIWTEEYKRMRGKEEDMRRIKIRIE